MRHAGLSGFNWYEGPFSNLNQIIDPDGEPAGYYHWQEVLNGEIAYSNTYATTETVDDALARIDEMPSPWLLWVAFNAPHRPWDLPPDDLHSYDLGLDITETERYHAIIEALDTEIGRLIDSIDPEILAETHIILLGDNGSPREVISAPSPDVGKGSLYEGGVNVPFIVVSPAVERPGSETAALIHTVDIFATIADIAGVRLSTLREPDGEHPLHIDGVSFLGNIIDPDAPSRRQYVYLEFFKAPWGARDDRGIRDSRWKLLRLTGGIEELYNLEGRDDDGPNLLLEPLSPEQTEAYERLGRELDRMELELVNDGF